tara:strand:+ start:795 stop:1082 length:288 start_codon:yes stop_codon:yes gene_type:complete
MGKEFYTDAIKLMSTLSRGNKSSRKVVGVSAKKAYKKKVAKSDSPRPIKKPLPSNVAAVKPTPNIGAIKPINVVGGIKPINSGIIAGAVPSKKKP